MKIDGEWNTGSTKEKRLYQARKEVYKQEAKKAFLQSPENKKWNKIIGYGAAGTFVLSVIGWCIVLWGDSDGSLANALPFGISMAGMIGFVCAICKDIVGRNFIKRYIAEKEIEDLKD